MRPRPAILTCSIANLKLQLRSASAVALKILAAREQIQRARSRVGNPGLRRGLRFCRFLQSGVPILKRVRGFGAIPGPRAGGGRVRKQQQQQQLGALRLQRAYSRNSCAALQLWCLRWMEQGTLGRVAL
ncbi:hypothetical protein BJX63DRAFT_53032 [Aspergillus granulosus]|uniref:Uncharacterized protein n=1 Tax=Aspergillus granulosus TaxID=176169 RepID=A0ABR4GZK8_9EURO